MLDRDAHSSRKRFALTATRWPVVPVFVASLCVFAPAGCVLKGDRGATATHNVAYWTPEPVEVRILSSSRLVQDNGQTVLEAGVEFVDDMGDPVKAAGIVRLTVQPPRSSGPAANADPLHWDIVLSTQEQQERWYDPVTRGYRFRLKLPESFAGQGEANLSIRYFDPRDRRLVTQQTVRQP